MGVSTALLLAASAAMSWQLPVLEIPEVGFDDPAVYQGYSTRFFRDSKQNAFQVYIDSHQGRVVNLWADGADASAAFTARDAAGNPALLVWDSPGIISSLDGRRRSVKYRLASLEQKLEVGWFLLGTMRQERDFQNDGWSLRPFGSTGFKLVELEELIESLEQLPVSERERHLAVLRSDGTEGLRRRLDFEPKISRVGDEWVVLVEHTSFDGQGRLTIELRGNLAESEAIAATNAVLLRARGNTGTHFDIALSTDNPELTPIDRASIFNREFEAFVKRKRNVDEAGAQGPPATRSQIDTASLTDHQRERAIVGMELLSTNEKLMAALPNYATYFGRDTMLAALMLEKITSVGLQERVIAGVLERLEDSGDVSHEEAVGEQAIRENASEYSELIRRWNETREADPRVAADDLDAARDLLGRLQSPRQNYRMVDDDFQFAVVVGRYLARPDVDASRKRQFLETKSPNGVRRLDALTENLALVARSARAYGDDPVVSNLVGFKTRDEDGYVPGSWRDSRAGFGNGRFAMDINVIWVPTALESLARIRDSLEALGFQPEELAALHTEESADLMFYWSHREALRAATTRWRGARHHFEVRLDPNEERDRLKSALAEMESDESAYWQRRVDGLGATLRPISFLALALDDVGMPILAMNTDVATETFLRDYTGAILRGELDTDSVLAEIEVLAKPFPIGLLIDGVGPVVVNDAYASPGVRRAFREDSYHSPRTVWGREVNLALLGLIRQIEAAYDSLSATRAGAEEMRRFAEALSQVLEGVLGAVEASGMRHNELWSYEVTAGSVQPARYGSSSDIQLWNLTDLAVDYELDWLRKRMNHGLP
jgi:hypothetical protein